MKLNICKLNLQIMICFRFYIDIIIPELLAMICSISYNICVQISNKIPFL